jgi:hypothetical protein
MLAACAPKVAQTVEEKTQPSVTSTHRAVVESATASATEDVVPQAIVTATPQLTLNTEPKVASVAEAEAALSSGAAFLEDLARENYDPAVVFAKPGTVTYTVSLTKSASVIWSYVWCAADEKTLATNLENIKLKFVLDDKEVPADSFGNFDAETGGKACRLVYTSLSDWTAGEHHLVTTATFIAKINDGSADFESGDYVLDYKVHIGP